MKFFIALTLVSFYAFAGDHYIGLGHNLGSKGKFDEVTSSDSSGEIDAELDFESSFEFSYEYSSTDIESWGYSVGVKYRPKVGIDEGEFDGEKVEFEGDTAEISSLAIYGNAIYRWDTFYIPFGLNITSIEWHKLSGSDSDVESNSGLGFNFGLGWNIGDSFQIEYTAMSNIWSLEFDDGSTVINYDRGTYAVAALTLKYKFL